MSPGARASAAIQSRRGPVISITCPGWYAMLPVLSGLPWTQRACSTTLVVPSTGSNDYGYLLIGGALVLVGGALLVTGRRPKAA